MERGQRDYYRLLVCGKLLAAADACESANTAELDLAGATEHHRSELRTATSLMRFVARELEHATQAEQPPLLDDEDQLELEWSFS